MKPTSLEACIEQSPVFWLDGGTGEELFRRNVPDDRKLWSATAVVHDEYHETLRDVHRSFLEAGSQAITTNTYGIIPSVGFSSAELQQYCEMAARIARQVVEERASQAYVLGSLGPLVESYRPDLIRKHDDGVAIYQLMITAMAPHIDAVLAETMSSVEEAMQAVDALAQYNNLCRDKGLSLHLSFTLQAQGNLRSNEPAEHALERILEYAQTKNVRVLAVMFNCCSPEAISIALQRIHDSESARNCLQSCVLGAYPNRLTEVAPDWTLAQSNSAQPFRTDLDPAHYAQLVQNWRLKYPLLRMIGGCCGITPDHIACLKKGIVE